MADSENLESGKFYMLGRDLANTEKSVRDKAVDTIRRELTSLKDATELEMMKLWKGLFYTFWMSDKPPVQEALAKLLSDMAFDFRSEKLTWMYIEVFWKTMVREWSGLDRLRLDKYCFLIRKMVSKMLRFLNDKAWSQEYVEKYNNLILVILTGTIYIGPFNQFCESFLEELAETLPHISSYDFMSLMTPLIIVLKNTTNLALIHSLKTRVFIRLLSDFNTVQEKGEKVETAPTFTAIDVRYVHSAFYEIVFSKEETLKGIQRRTLSEMELKYEEFVSEHFTSPEAPTLTAPSRTKEEKAAVKTSPKKEKTTVPEKKEKNAKKTKKVVKAAKGKTTKN